MDDEIEQDPCEWNPKENRPAYKGEDHAPAKVLIGSGAGSWMLCISCSNLPEFVEVKNRFPIDK